MADMVAACPDSLGVYKLLNQWFCSYQWSSEVCLWVSQISHPFRELDASLSPTPPSHKKTNPQSSASAKAQLLCFRQNKLRSVTLPSPL
jgi:hypothetical protein